MRTIVVSPEVHDAIIKKALGDFRETGTRREDGWWLLPVDDDVYASLAHVPDVDAYLRERLGLPPRRLN
jgi:hypothetical protein